MQKSSFTTISSLGEFKLIEKLTKDIQLNHISTHKGIGDDAAVLKQSTQTEQLISSDMLVEGIHFDTTYTPLKHLGYKSMVVNISDLCAMNGTATHALVNIGVSNKYSVEHMQELYEGLKLACRNYNIDLIGGDTTSSPAGLVISISVLGSCDKQKITYRRGAKPNDILLVSGDLGGAYLGLQILEREKEVFNKNTTTQPVLDKYKYILSRQLKPEARVDVIKTFNELEIVPSSMIDISDGLSSDLKHICSQSKNGVKIFENKIPISKEAKLVSDEFKINPIICALHGGEDYELLFTVSQKDFNKIKNNKNFTPIGHITSGQDMELVTESENTINLTEEGWDSFIKQKRSI